MTKKESFISNLSGKEFHSSDERIQAILDKSKIAINNLEFPTTKSEKWKYSRVTKIVNGDFSKESKFKSPDPKLYEIEGLDSQTAVFVNGNYVEELSSVDNSEGISVGQTREILGNGRGPGEFFGKGTDSENEIFTALNTLYLHNGVSIETFKNYKGEQHLHLVFITEGEGVIHQPRNIIKLGQSSDLHVLVSFINIGEEKNFTNHVCEFFLEENSNLEVNIIQSMGSESFLINEFGGIQKDNSRLQINTFTEKGNWIRNNTTVRVSGKNCTTNLYGAYLPKDKEHIDNQTVIDHLLPHCESNELYKGVASDKSTCVFNGKVFVREDAQKTNAYQQNAHILLSDDAQINSKPELEIYADDVKCSHGSTTGQFDKDALYYLRSRGISEEKSRKMLISAFVAEVIDQVSNEEIQEHVRKIMSI